MRNLIYLVSLSALVCLLGCAGPASPQSQDVEENGDDFTGAWDFVRLDTPDGPSTTQQGMMVVFGDYVCHVRIQKDRDAIAEDDSAEVKGEKATKLLNGSNAACGTFTRENDRLTVNWSTAVKPETQGNATEFILTTEGDTVLLAPAAAPQFKFVYQRLR